MFNSNILDIAIGMILTYLLLSLVITSVNEFLASLLKWRAKNLCDGIRNLLDDQDMNKAFFDHPLIKGLSEKGSLPSYIPSRTFMLTLLDLVSPTDPTKPKQLEDIQNAIKNIPNEQVRKSLTLLLEDAGHDLRAFEEGVETWFNHAMDRVSGWYKRKTQYVLLALALVVVVVLNIDSIQVYRSLSDDPVLRASLVKMAEQIDAQGPPATQTATEPQPGGATRPAEQTPEEIQQETREKLEALKKSMDDVQALGIPIGWQRDDLPQGAGWIWKIVGLLVTAFACSLGAPFWFDLLNKIISVRSAGKAPEEKPKPPKKVQQPVEPGQTPKEADALEAKKDED
jgi:hypothetical protein